MSTYKIIRDASIFREFVPLSYAFDVEEMTPHFDTIAERYLIPECGRPLWDEITLAQEDGQMTSLQKETLRALQRPFANLCALAHLPFLDAKIGNGGITVTSQGDQVPASQYRVKAIKNQLWNSGYQALDSLIAFLIANESALATYDGSVFAENTRSRILNKTEEATTYVPNINNRWLFRRMVPIIDRISAGRVKAVLTPALYADIIRSISEQDDPNIYTPTVLPLLKNALTHLAWAEAITELGIQVDENGVTTFTLASGSYEMNGRKQIEGTVENKQVAHHLRIGETQLQNTLDSIIADAGSYPAYVQPESYTADHMPRIEAQTDDKIYSPFL